MHGARLEFAVSDLGEAKLKNIAEPVRIYSLEVGVPRAGEIRGRQPQSPSRPRNLRRRPLLRKPSIAVLAFNNLSGDAEQEYFSDGISEDIITDLSTLSELHVVARNSSFVYKKAAVSVADVAKALGVRYVLEGSVRKAGNRVRVTTQLIDSDTGGHVWANRFDRELTDIFAIQDELTKEIVSALKVKLTLGEQDRLDSSGATSMSKPSSSSCAAANRLGRRRGPPISPRAACSNARHRHRSRIVPRPMPPSRCIPA